MKKLFISLIILAFCSSGWGQNLVSIPDSAFRMQLKSQFSQLFVGDLLDTMAASNVFTQIEISGPSVQSLEGLQYFKSFYAITINGTNIQFVPQINGTYFSDLFISNNPNLEAINNFPDTLNRLWVYNNSTLTFIPSLPKSASSIILSSNNISHLPPLPNNLNGLDCSNNPLLKCLGILPNALNYLTTDVSCIENIPSSLTGPRPPLCNSTANPFNCNYVQPVKPTVFGYIFYDQNQNGILDANENKLGNKSLTVQPGNITEFANASGNYSFYADTINSYTLYPNTVSGYILPSPVTLPILSSNTRTEVNFALTTVSSSIIVKNRPTIYGTVFYDLNQNNVQDSSDQSIPNKQILIQPGNIRLFSNSMGYYEYTLDTIQNYTVSLASDSTIGTTLPKLTFNSRTAVNFPLNFTQGYLIPDTAFRNQLKTQFPICFIGELLDTICAASATGYGYLTAYGSNIVSVQGIQFFKRVQYIYITGTSITTIPKLPETTLFLHIGDNPFLNKITNLPDSLGSIYINGNSQLDSLPKLSKNLTVIYASYNHFSQLPKLPERLITLVCKYNGLTSLPVLPSTLQYLDCSNNLLTTFPNIPDSLNRLDCSSNQLVSLPDLTSKKLGNVAFNNNRISECPEFGENIYSIVCINNPFKCLKKLPYNLALLGTDVSCIPNTPKYYGVGMFTVSGILPVCNPANNPNNCNANPIISGTVYYDLNNNQTYDLGDAPAANEKITIQPFGGTTFTNSLGQYVYSIDTIGTYILSASTVPYFSVSAPLTVNGLNLNATTTANFYLTKLADVKDVSIAITPYQAAARPGFYFSLDVEVKNNGSLPTPSTVSMQLPNSYSVTGITFPTCSSTSVISSCNLGTLSPGEIVHGKIEGRIAISAILGDSLLFGASVNPGDAADANLSDNESLVKFIVRGSYDPNDKAGTQLDPQKVDQSQWIDYTIRFQNTGTDTAFTVVVSDSLPSQLISSSVEVLSASHDYTFSKIGSVLYFSFNNILLPDSTTNLKDSNGFVKFRVKTKPNLLITSTVNNRAAIYFDYNSPVITNYAVSSFIPIGRVTSVYTSASQNLHSWVYPNPVENGRLLIHSAQNETAQLFNSSGNLVFNGKIGEEGLNVSHLPSGIYLLYVGNHKEKVVIE